MKLHERRQDDLKPARRGSAAVELALALPVLLLMLVIAIDFGRIFYPFVTITNCARNGAIYLSEPDPVVAPKYFATYQDATVADGGNLRNPNLTVADVTSTTGVADGHAYAEVTVTYSFEMLTSYLGFKTQNLQRTIRAPVLPQVPDL